MTTPNFGEDVEKLDHSYFDGDNVKWHSHSEKFLMKLTKHAVSFNPAIVVLGICPREMKACCLSLFGLLSQSTTYCVAYKQQKFLIVQKAEKFKIVVLAHSVSWWRPISWFIDDLFLTMSPLCPRGAVTEHPGVFFFFL